MPLTLRPTTTIDIPFVLAAERAKDARSFVMLWSEEQHADAIVDGNQEHLLVQLDKELVGFVLLAGLTDSPSCIELRRIVVVTTGVGFGGQAIKLVLARVFDTAKADQVWLDVKPGNARARRCYERLGFIEKERRDSFVLMSLRRTERESQ